MALNTPKRVRTALDAFGGPPAGYDPPPLLATTGHYPPQPHAHQHHQQHVQHPYQHYQHQQQQQYTIISTTTTTTIAAAAGTAVHQPAMPQPFQPHHLQQQPLFAGAPPPPPTTAIAARTVSEVLVRIESPPMHAQTSHFAWMGSGSEPPASTNHNHHQHHHHHTGHDSITTPVYSEAGDSFAIGSPPANSAQHMHRLHPNVRALIESTPPSTVVPYQQPAHLHLQHQQQFDAPWANNNHAVHAAHLPSVADSPAGPVTLSPDSSCASPEFLGRSGASLVASPTPTSAVDPSTPGAPAPMATTPTSGAPSSAENSRRGRPRSEALSTLMIEGSTSPSAIKCGYCHRVFPREKSLQAHLRTHTGERPYPCDYPGCTRAFTQSGQLKTHQRLHTGERPFMCSVDACQQRFTHANRHCPDHPYGTLRRCDDDALPAGTSAQPATTAACSEQQAQPQSSDVQRWLEKYRADKEERTTPSRRTPKRTSLTKAKLQALSGRGLVNQENVNQPQQQHQQQQHAVVSSSSSSSPLAAVGSPYQAKLTSAASLPLGQLQQPNSPSTPCNPRKSLSRKGLMQSLDMNAVGASPIAATKKPAAPKQIQWTEMPVSQEEDSGNDDDVLDDEDGFAQLMPAMPQSTFNPKKRWLREAWQDDLARPLEPASSGGKAAAATAPPPMQPMPVPRSPPRPATTAKGGEHVDLVNDENRSTFALVKHAKLADPLQQQQQQSNVLRPLNDWNHENQRHPNELGAVPLLGAVKCDSVPSTIGASPGPIHRKWLGAMALMQLATNDDETPPNVDDARNRCANATVYESV